MKKIQLFLTANLFVIILSGCAFAAAHTWTIPTAHAMSVTLAWDANQEPDLAGYFVYHGLPNMEYSEFIKHSNVGNVTTYTVTDLAGGQTYRFVATATDEYGNESDYSDEVAYDPPPLSATDLVITEISDGDISFLWIACPNDDVAEYQLYHRLPGATEWVSPALWTGPGTLCTIPYPGDGNFTVVVFDQVGQNSEDSNIVTTNLPPAPVEGLLIEAYELSLQTTERIAGALASLGHPMCATGDMDYDSDIDGSDLAEFCRHFGSAK